MKSRVPAFLFALAIGLSFSQVSRAAVVFKPGKKVKYVAPGEEEMNGNAEELFHVAQKAEENGNVKRARCARPRLNISRRRIAGKDQRSYKRCAVVSHTGGKVSEQSAF
jgi:hypothetical protein